MNDPRLEDTGRGLTVLADGRYLYSKYQPQSRAAKIAASAPLESKCLYFVPSPLLGYGLSELADRIPEDSLVLAVETEQEIMALCSPELPERITSNPRIVQVRLSDISSLHALLYEIGPWRFRRIRRVDLSGGASLNPGLYDRLAAFLVQDLTSYWRNRHALGRFGREWTRHILANLAEISYGEKKFNSIADLHISGIPLVVGAGPSLETALPFIRKFRDKLWILAADTAIPALITAGINPDAAAVLETQAWNLLDFHGTDGSLLPVIADITAYPPSLTHTGGPCFLFSSDFAELNFVRRLDEANLRGCSIPPLGSVGLAALEVTMIRSDGPILLTGLDFAYKPGKSHARGTSFHQWQLSAQIRLNPHPGWEASIKRPRLESPDASGRPLKTDSILQGYAAILKDRYSGSGRFFVLAPGGLDLGLPVLNESDAESLILNTSSDEGAQESAPVNVINAESALAFLDVEKSRLDLVIDKWDDYVDGRSSSADLTAALEGLDEIFSDFPDEPPLPKNEDSFLVRAATRSRQLLRYIDRIQSR